nr:PBSX family phage terminase large subunit [Oscillospiraceae bacterium]
MSKEFTAFSPKQMQVLNWWCEESVHKDKIGIICDGAVRSGKTLCMTLSFVLWTFYRFSDSDFAICGKTVTSLRRNVITPILPIRSDMGFSV